MLLTYTHTLLVMAGPCWAGPQRHVRNDGTDEYAARGLRVWDPHSGLGGGAGEWKLFVCEVPRGVERLRW